MILLDTNVLVYALDDAATQHQECVGVLELAVSARMPAVLLPQVLVECYSVITSKRRVARPLTIHSAVLALKPIREAVPVMDPPAEALDTFEVLLRAVRRTGAMVFDVYLAAQMTSLAIREICTLNSDDFDRLGVQPMSPTEVLVRYA